MSKKNDDFFRKKNIWSEVKDELLSCYLVPYVQKILTTNRPLFYVDCFAGKGRFDDGKKGSPLIALEIINDCLEKTRMQRPRVESCFIELNHADDLEKNIREYGDTRVEIDIVSGKFEENIESKLQGKRGYNVFLYIDPYGIKALDCGLFDKFAGYGFNSIEMLINMNSFGFIRDACSVFGVAFSDVEPFEELVEYDPSSAKSIQTLNNIAGGDYWISIVADYKARKITGYEAEQRFSKEYCERLRKKYKYVLNMPIRLKVGQRPKYRMIHATNHVDGCILMYKNICKRWERLGYIQTQGQGSLWDLTMEGEIVDDDTICALMKQHVSQYITFTRLNIVIADFLLKHGILCKPDAIRNTIKYLEDIGFIDVNRYYRSNRNKKPRRRFYTEDGDRVVELRKSQRKITLFDNI